MSGETEKMTANHYQLAAKEILSEREVEVLTSLGRRADYLRAHGQGPSSHHSQ
jgi:hypothetical protein